MADCVPTDASQAGKLSRAQRIGTHSISMNPGIGSRVKHFFNWRNIPVNNNHRSRDAKEKPPETHLIRNSAVPPGLESFGPFFPALKRWAKLGRPFGAGSLCLFSHRSNHRVSFVTAWRPSGLSVLPRRAKAYGIVPST